MRTINDLKTGCRALNDFFNDAFADHDVMVSGYESSIERVRTSLENGLAWAANDENIPVIENIHLELDSKEFSSESTELIKRYVFSVMFVDDSKATLNCVVDEIQYNDFDTDVIVTVEIN